MCFKSKPSVCEAHDGHHRAVPFQQRDSVHNFIKPAISLPHRLSASQSNFLSHGDFLSILY